MNNNLTGTRGSSPSDFIDISQLHRNSHSNVDLIYLNEFTRHLKQALGSTFGHMLEVPHPGAGIEFHVAMLDKFSAHCVSSNHDQTAMEFIQQALSDTLRRISPEGLEGDTHGDINNALKKAIASATFVPVPKNCSTPRFEYLNHHLRQYTTEFLQPIDIVKLSTLSTTIRKKIDESKNFLEIAIDKITRSDHLKTAQQDNLLKMSKKTGSNAGMLLSAALFTTGQFFFDRKGQPKDFTDGKNAFETFHSAIQKLPLSEPHPKQLHRIMKGKRSLEKLAGLLNEIKLYPERLHLHTLTLVATKVPVHGRELPNAIAMLYEHVHEHVDVKHWPDMYVAILDISMTLDPGDFKLVFDKVLAFIKTIENEGLRSKLLAKLAPSISRLPLGERLQSARRITSEIFRLNDRNLFAEPLSQLPLKSLGKSEEYKIWLSDCIDGMQGIAPDHLTEPLAHFVNCGLIFTGGKSKGGNSLEKCMVLAGTLPPNKLARFLTTVVEEMPVFGEKHNQFLMPAIMDQLVKLDARLIRTPLDSIAGSLTRLDKSTAARTRKRIHNLLNSLDPAMRSKLVESLKNARRLKESPVKIEIEFLGRKRDPDETLSDDSF